MIILMPTINKESLRDQFSQAKQSAKELIAAGKVPAETQLLINTLLTLLELVIAVFLEKVTKKTKANSGIPPSETSQTEDKKQPSPGSNPKGSQSQESNFSNSRTIETIDLVTVDSCNVCGNNLQDQPVDAVERRTRIDLHFVKVVEHQDVEIKTCSCCNTKTKGVFSGLFQHVLQYGIGIQAFAVNLLCAQMVSLSRVQELLKSMLDRVISETTLLNYLLKMHHALELWEQKAIAYLLKSRAMHVDETSMKVNTKNHWVHVCSSGHVTLKKLHEKRGIKAMEAHDIIPRYGGVIVHDCWQSYFSFENCGHGLCGAHLVRELQFIIESNEYIWAKRMKKMLLQLCSAVSKQESKKLTLEQYHRVRRIYDAILKRGEYELPVQPKPEKKTRGRLAKTDAENLHERLVKHAEAVLLFAKESFVPFTNNQAEQALRMGKVKQKVSGCFRSREFADAYLRISSYLQTMKAIGYNPFTAIEIALDGRLNGQLEDFFR